MLATALTSTFDGDNVWLGLIVVASTIVALYTTHLRLHHNTAPAEKPQQPDLPLALEDEAATRFTLWTRLSFYFRCEKLYGDVWHRFSKVGRAVLVPMCGTRKEIFLPHSSIPWATSQPHKTLGMWDAFSDMFQLGHSLGDDKYMIDTWSHYLARHVLTQELDDHLMDIHDELLVALETHLGTDTEHWKTLNLVDTVRIVINQTASRFTVGEELCRNQTYLRRIMDTIDSIIANAGAAGFFPEWLRPAVGKVICFPTRLRLWNLSTYYRDVFKTRIQQLEEDSPDQPVDLLQKMLRFTRKHRPEELATDQFTRRMCMANLAFIYLASFTTTNILAQIMASDEQYGTIDTLRAEADEFFATHTEPKELWSRKNTQQMIKVDSAMRETMRLYNAPTRTIVRKVMVDNLVTDAGLHLPKGSLVSFVSQPMHYDPERFTNPTHYDPFRFVRLRREPEEAAKAQARPEDVGGDWNEHSFLSTAGLLTFGRGKNACPGRFLIEIKLKMLISYLLRDYDIRLKDGQQPKNKWIMEFILPDSGLQFEVRRRKTT